MQARNNTWNKVVTKDNIRLILFPLQRPDMPNPNPKADITIMASPNHKSK